MRVNCFIACFVPFLGLILIAIGCNQSSSDFDAIVQGTVTIDGELAPGGTVTFYPVENGPTAVGGIASNGSYALRVGQGYAGNPDGSHIPSGEYVATVSVTAAADKGDVVAQGGPPKLGVRLIADKYTSKATSNLKFEVASGRNVLDLKLEGPWANPSETEDKQAEDTGAEASTSDKAHPQEETSRVDDAASTAGEDASRSEGTISSESTTPLTTSESTEVESQTSRSQGEDQSE